MLTQDRQGKQAAETKDRQTGVKRNERNIPLSEGFEICFCLIVSEREERGEGEEHRQKTQKWTDGAPLGLRCLLRAAAEK